MRGEILEDHCFSRFDLKEKEEVRQKPLECWLEVEGEQSQCKQQSNDDEDDNLTE